MRSPSAPPSIRTTAPKAGAANITVHLSVLGSTNRTPVTILRSSAATLSGFVAPDVVADRVLLGYTGQLNQGFARVSVAAIGASLILWGVALWATRGFARLPAAAGVIIGAVLALGVLTGWLNLTASGIVIVTLLQGIWIILVAAHLLREGSNGRNV